MKDKNIILAKHIASYFSASLLPMFLTLLVNPLISLNMTPEDFAISGYYLSFSSLITPLISFYFLQYYIKRYFEYDQNERKKLKSAIVKMLVTYSFLASIGCMLCILGYIFLLDEDFSLPIFPYLPLAVLALPLTGLYNLELAEFKMQRNSKSFFKLSMINGIINAVCLVLFIVVIKLGGIGKLLAPFLANFILFIYVLRKYQNLLKNHIEKSYYKSMFIFCYPLALAAMLGYFTNGFDRTYLEKLNNTIELGYYTVAVSIANILFVCSTAIGNTFQPDVYEAISLGNNRKLLKVFGVQLSILVVIISLFEIICPIAVYLLTAGKYMESTQYTRIICLSTFTSALYFNINCVTIAKGFPNLSLITSVIGSFLIFFLMPIIVDNYGFIGGAWMNSLSYIIFFIVNILLLFFALKLRSNKI